jgi:hypothetical protein
MSVQHSSSVHSQQDATALRFVLCVSEKKAVDLLTLSLDFFWSIDLNVRNWSIEFG